MPAKRPEQDGAGQPEHGAGDTVDAHHDHVDRDRSKVAAHPVAGVLDDLDDQRLGAGREEVDQERLEPVAGGEPEEAHHQHQDQIGHGRGDGPADGDQVLAGLSQRTLHLAGELGVADADVPLDGDDEVDGGLLVRGEVLGQALRLAHHRLDQQGDDDHQEAEDHQVDDGDGRGAWQAQLLDPGDERPHPLGDHHRDQEEKHEAGDLDDHKDEGEDQQDDERGPDQGAHLHDLARVTPALREMQGTGAGSAAGAPSLGPPRGAGLVDSDTAPTVAGIGGLHGGTAQVEPAGRIRCGWLPPTRVRGRSGGLPPNGGTGD